MVGNCDTIKWDDYYFRFQEINANQIHEIINNGRKIIFDKCRIVGKWEYHDEIQNRIEFRGCFFRDSIDLSSSTI